MAHQMWNAGIFPWNELRIANKSPFRMPQHAADGVSRKEREKDRALDREKFLANLGFQRDELSSREGIAKLNATAREQGFDVRRDAAQSGADARKYGADKSLEGRKYAADTGLEGRKYSADSRLQGTYDTNDTKMAVEQIKAKTKAEHDALWDTHNAEMERIRELAAQGKITQGQAQNEMRKKEIEIKDKQASLHQQALVEAKRHNLSNEESRNLDRDLKQIGQYNFAVNSNNYAAKMSAENQPDAEAKKTYLRENVKMPFIPDKPQKRTMAERVLPPNDYAPPVDANGPIDAPEEQVQPPVLPIDNGEKVKALPEPPPWLQAALPPPPSADDAVRQQMVDKIGNNPKVISGAMQNSGNAKREMKRSQIMTAHPDATPEEIEQFLNESGF